MSADLRAFFESVADIDLRGEPAPEALLSDESYAAYLSDCEPYWRARAAAAALAPLTHVGASHA